MKFSLEWLNEFVSLEEYMDNPYLLAELLTLKGLEVEDIQVHRMDNIYVGQILSQKKHPQADRLQLCEVQVFKNKPSYQIICGAQNQKEKDKVVVCLEGSRLPNGLEIKNRKIRGQESQGMLASREELGELKKEEGIWILPSDIEMGERLDKALGFQKTCLDITIHPNRSDLLSHLGMARELSGILNRPLKLSASFWPHQQMFLGVPEKHLKKMKQKKFQIPFSKKNIQKKVYIEDSKLCPLYQYGIILNVQVKPSPLWLKNGLEAIGLKSINNIVDVTNWILIEWGQPLHAFDLSKIEGDIHVRFSQSQSRFKTLDKKEIELCGDELMITDDHKPLALAGIIGGENSAIQEGTTNILIESAIFAPYLIRRISRRFGLDTDASFRYARGVFPQTTQLALEKACEMMVQVAGGEIVPYSFKKMSLKPRHLIEIEEKDLHERMGQSVALSEFENWMKKMHLKVKKKRFKKIVVEPPYYRKDLSIKEDLIEEWARLKGYDSVPEILPQIHFKNEWKKQHLWLEFLDETQKITKEQGFYQAINYNFVDHDFQSSFLGSKLDSPIFIQNPISQEMNSLRQSLLPMLFKNIWINVRHGQNLGRLFEQGVSFSKDKEEFKENTCLGLALWGQRKDIWEDSSKRSVIFDLKSGLENILRRMGYSDWKWEKIEDEYPFLHPHQSLCLWIENQKLGLIGRLNPLLKDKNKIKEDVALGEINLSLLYSIHRKKFVLNPLCDFPLVYRDISLLMKETSLVSDVLDVFKENKSEFFKNVSVVDLYDGVQKGYKAVTFRLSLQSDKETLSEKQISKYIEKINFILCKKLNVEIR